MVFVKNKLEITKDETTAIFDAIPNRAVKNSRLAFVDTSPIKAMVDGQMIEKFIANKIIPEISKIFPPDKYKRINPIMQIT